MNKLTTVSNSESMVINEIGTKNYNKLPYNDNDFYNGYDYLQSLSIKCSNYNDSNFGKYTNIFINNGYHRVRYLGELKHLHLDKIIVNNPAVIIKTTDGNIFKSVAKDEKFDVEKGFLLALVKFYNAGYRLKLSNTQLNKLIKKVSEYEYYGK